MALTRRTVVNQIEITEGGHLQVRIALQIVDGDQVIQSKWHRTVIDRGGDPEAQLGYVNQHLAEMGEEPLLDKDITKVRRYFDLTAEINDEE